MTLDDAQDLIIIRKVQILNIMTFDVLIIMNMVQNLNIMTMDVSRDLIMVQRNVEGLCPENFE